MPSLTFTRRLTAATSAPARCLRMLGALALTFTLTALGAAIAPTFASAATSTYSYTGAPQQYTVPANVHALDVSVVGAAGGAYQTTPGQRYYDMGFGGIVNATVPVTPGQTLWVYVGGNGTSSPSAGGYNGGGSSTRSIGGGSGGGASDIRTTQGDLNSRLVVAGGGGGGGSSNGGSAYSAGNAGYPAGAMGKTSTGFNDSLYGGPGGGGTQTAGGSGGTSSPYSGSPGLPGSFGQGGDNYDDIAGATGGGGGGGYYGGGGGSEFFGGGGGSDYVDAAATATGFGIDTSRNPSVAITPQQPQLSVSPDPYDYGAVSDGQPQSEDFTVTNSGRADLTIGPATLSGAQVSDYAVKADNCSNQTITPGAQCTITIAFTPSTNDTEETAQLNIPNNDPDQGGSTAVSLQAEGQTPPAISTSPTSVDFGQAQENQTATENVTVTNHGEAPLQPGASSVSDDANSEFSVVNDGCSGQSVTQGQSCTITVGFIPSTHDSQETAQLDIPSNDPAQGGSTAVSLQGEGQTPPTITASPSLVDFAQVDEGQSATENVTVTNSGEEPLHPGARGISADANSEFSITNDGCSGQSLDQGQSCIIKVQFAPTTHGSEETAQLNIPNDDPTESGSTAVSLQGDGVAGSLSVSPSSASYGPVPDGQSETQTLTVSDTGTGTVDIGADALGGADAGQFAIISDPCANATLTASGPGRTCTIAVRYSASTRGNVAAELDIASDASNAASGSTAVALSGTGMALPAAGLSASTEDFGQATTGATKDATVTLTNGGDLPLNVGQASIGGADAAQFSLTHGQDACSNTSVAPHASCTIDVAFSPRTDGAKSATLTVASNDPNSPATVSLSGTAQTPPTAVLSASSRAFGQLSTGSSKDEVLSITNTGDETLNVGQATIVGPDAGQFALAAGEDSCSGTSVATGSSCLIVLTFSPASAGAKTAQLQVPSNDPASPATVPLSGTAVNGPTATTSQDFGTVTVGQAPLVNTITIANTGGQSLTLGAAALGGANADQFAVVSGRDGCSAQTLPAGGACTIAVRFAPTQTGTLTATLSIPSNAPGSPTTVGLSGVGQAQPTSQPPTQKPPAQPPTLTPPSLPASGLTVRAGATGSHTTVTLQLSAPGTVTVAMERQVAGQWVPAGTQTLTATQAGPLPLTLGTSFGGHRLTTGSYRLVVQASAHGQSSPVVKLPLTVTPPNGPHGQPRLLSAAVTPRAITWRQGDPAPRLWLTFLLSRAATLNLTIEARAGGGWQQVSSTTVHVSAGSDRVQLVGRWHGQMVPPRLLRLTVRASAAGMSSVTRTFYVTVQGGQPTAGR